MKILLLEDDAGLNRSITKVIQIDKHTTTSYLDGQDVLDNLDECYDLYILDINVPNINGLELLKLIYAKDSTSKVIIISSNTDISYLRQAYNFGCIDYLKKPFHVEELRIKIAKLDTPLTDLISTIKFKDDDNRPTKREKDLLMLLLKHKDTVVTYSMIEANLYKDSMSMDSLRALVKRLRHKLADDIIQNILEEGYKITCQSRLDE